jgi:uncharacterized protein (TIGR02145 family)
MKIAYSLLFALFYINIAQAQNVGLGTVTPATELDVNGGIKTKYSGQLSVTISGIGMQTLHLPIAPVPISWDNTNTIVIVNNVDGGSGVIHQAKLETNASIALIYEPDITGAVRFSYVIFLWSTPLSLPFPVTYICNKLWATTNLNVSTYRNGETIPQVTDPTEWASLTTGAWCWYNNDSATYASTYGRLYNWYAVNDPRGLAPLGWHIPSDAEWSALSTCLGGSAVAGGKIKETGTTHWASPNTGADNSSGFTALPGGQRFDNGGFFTIGTLANFWSSTEISIVGAWLRSVNNVGSVLTRDAIFKPYGYSVRCVHD